MRQNGITRTDWAKLKAMPDSEIKFTADAPQTSSADWALFGKSTQAMKTQWQVPGNRPLADFAPTIILKAKDFATEITNFNARQHSMRDERAISNEHITNNEAVRNTLLERGIRPESLAPVEDVKKVERRLSAGDKQAQKKPDALPPV
jgi:DNA-damage-inducible protein D